MSTPRITIGPFVVGEVPDALEYQYLDANGAPLIVTGYNATFTCREVSSGVPTVDVGAVAVTDGAIGKVTYIWTGIEFPTPGTYIAEFWVGNTSQRYASSLITFDVRTQVGSVPNI